MKHLCTLVTALVLGFAPFLTHGQSAKTHEYQLAEKVIGQLSLINRVEQLPENFVEQFEQNPFRLSEKVNQKWLEAFKEAYNKKRLMQDYRSILADKLNKLPANKINEWLKQTSTQELAQAREQHHSLQGKRKQIVAMYELEQDSLSQNRKELLSNYAEAILPAGALMESSIIVFHSVLKSIDKLSDNINFTDVQINQLTANFRQQEPDYVQQMKDKKLPVVFFGVSSNPIEQSLHFWQSQTGQLLTEAIYASLQQTYKQAAERLADHI
ncbi:MAG TPA: hypothetical protein VK106_06940 [Balneolaceae bacterium]|nr:hypothetical protein [Balneolaceae bacterium]